MGTENNKRDFSWQLSRRGRPSRWCYSQVAFGLLYNLQFMIMHVGAVYIQIDENER